MQVVEHITYDFTGQFHYGTRPIPVGAYTISDMHVTEHGQELLDLGRAVQPPVVLHRRGRAAHVRHRLHGDRRALVGAPDVAELYWKWVGEDHPTIGLVTATLHVPPGRGPLAGVGPRTAHRRRDGRRRHRALARARRARRGRSWRAGSRSRRRGCPRCP